MPSCSAWPVPSQPQSFSYFSSSNLQPLCIMFVFVLVRVLDSEWKTSCLCELLSWPLASWRSCPLSDAASIYTYVICCNILLVFLVKKLHYEQKQVQTHKFHESPSHESVNDCKNGAVGARLRFISKSSWKFGTCFCTCPFAQQEVAAKIPAHLAGSAQRKPLNWGQSIHQTDTPCTNCVQSSRQHVQSSELL